MTSPKAILFTLSFLQLGSSYWAFQTGQQTVHQPSYNPFISSFQAPASPYVPTGGSASPQWQFAAPKSGVPTWIITTTEIETRNETVPVEDREDDDAPVGPNLSEDSTDATIPEDVEDSDVEFPVRHGKDPAIKASPAFADPEKYDETMTPMPSMEENAKNQTKIVTVNRTTVVKIEFMNTAFLPLVLRIDSSHKANQDTNATSDEQQQKGDSSTSSSSQMYSSNEGQRRDQQDNRSGQQDQATQYTPAGPEAAKEQRTTQTFHVVQDQAQAQQQAGAGQQVAGTPVSYQQFVHHLPPVPLAGVQPLYPSQYVNYWKRR